ncbi:hypothetical protein SKAU_G00173070 [Synaphobranchus kaupii]|uniref:Hexose-6-phosphate dehydrogenase/glucose 1-dehydrogenase n=1 Tax=Synaphobranchus kaupii TaxID=118154 RepID=A0A9Q1J118_SYNKA|nr:hypothetical protein SKAU_G00173070 [Synaphobranchus kaupii]
MGNASSKPPDSRAVAGGGRLAGLGLELRARRGAGGGLGKLGKLGLELRAGGLAWREREREREMMWKVVFALTLLGEACLRPGCAKEGLAKEGLAKEGLAKEGLAKEGLAKESKGHVSVVVVGATGDLARKYLWQGFFQLYADQVSSGHSFSFYGGALSEAEKGKPALFQILKGLECPQGLSEDRCALLREQFLKLTEYWELKTAEDYGALSEEMGRRPVQEGLVEAGRLFYLSVPAFAYADVTDKINASCRPPQGVWLRVVLEKPFGHDLDSAQVLATQLEKSLKGDEMYRIDHYLGKQVVSQILPFRKQNRVLLEPIWNKHHIERIEIVLKETLDAKDGVLLPVLPGYCSARGGGGGLVLVRCSPSSLSSRPSERTPSALQLGAPHGSWGRQMSSIKLKKSLVLLTMGVPGQADQQQEGLRNKLAVFGSLQQLTKRSAVIGQYQAYSGEVQAELNDTEDHISMTPTFAGVVVHMDNAQFDGIPIFLISGKMLDERVGYARVLFKNKVFCVQSPESIHCKPRQIVFYFGHGDLKYPAILGQQEPVQTSHSTQGLEGTQRPSWPPGGFWTPLLAALAHEFPRLYPGGAANGNMLDLQARGREVAFISEAVVIPQDVGVGGGAAASESFQVMQGKFRSSDMVSAWAEELINRLATDLQEAADEARLALHHYAFPWRHTHVWMVDERCVPLTEPGSNFHSLHDRLLQSVRLPYFNAHPMPVQLNQRLCVEEDGGPLVYERDIARLVNGSSFHFILLGVGYDGHTASLFPDTPLGAHGGRLVALTESPVKPHQRMSLTLNAINQAQRVGVLVTGKGKHELIIQLSRVKDNPQKWPITGVRPTVGKLVWYIDYDALLGLNKIELMSSPQSAGAERLCCLSLLLRLQPRPFKLGHD